jgi:ADP-ribosylglycohydrolase
MAGERTSRARGCLVGLAVGDALGGPTEGKSFSAIEKEWGRVTGFLKDDQAGSDDTEYALFNAGLLIRYGRRLSADLIADHWKKDIALASNAYAGAGFSEMLAMRNLTRGLLPPASGRHLHSWSDGLAMRVAPFGIVAGGRPALAARLAEMDGCVTHAGEGIYSGQAVAAAVAQAMTGAPLPALVDAACGVIPADSWTRRGIDTALRLASKSSDLWGALPLLYGGLANTAYHWPDIAPEAVGMAFGIVVASRGVFRDAVLGGVNIGRDTDTIAGIVGAILGAQQGIGAIPAEWAGRLTVSRGVCLAAVRGMNIEETADRLAQVAGAWGDEP